VYTGRIFDDLKKYPKIVGGVTSQCGVKGEFFYNQVLEFEVRQDLMKANGVWMVDNCETAEFVKLAETTYRDVNIALANQFANFAEKIRVDIFSVIEACNSQSTSYIHQPGISVGGHCIPVYPHLYLWGDKNADIVRISRNLNASRPVHLLNQLQKLIDGFEGKKILLLGLSYRPNVKETAYSGALTILDELLNQKAEIQVEDPLFTNAEILGIFSSVKKIEDHEIDAIIIHTEDKHFLKITQRNFRPDCVILDGRGLFRSQAPTTFYTFDKLTDKL
jgi:nucleotide sugar dehydrogenase